MKKNITTIKLINKMGFQEVYEKYKNARTGQDLIDLGVVPKSSSRTLTLITYKRLQALQKDISSTLNEKLVGDWLPLVEKKASKYSLRPGVVSDEKLGWKIRMKKEFKGNVSDKDGNGVYAEIPGGELGMIRGYDARDNRAMIAFDNKVSGRNIYRLRLEEIAEAVQVSSLGQIIPEDRERMIFNQAMAEFFPNTRLDTDRAYRWIMGMIMDKDLIAYGEPGSGKSTLARDVVSILSEQQIRFEVEGCRFGCNPFSLFDTDYGKLTPPCPDCMIKYNGDRKLDFKETGIFVPPKPKDVPISVVKFGKGHGVAYMEGNVEIKRQHLVGFKLPKLDGTTDQEREDQANPEGFSPGVLIKSHNGILHVEEIDKLRDTTRDSLLEVGANSRVQPEQLKYELPCRNTIIGTANDPTVLSEPLKDRFFLMAIRYPTDMDVAQKMLRVSYYGERTRRGSIDIGDIHIETDDILRDVPMPRPLENAVTSFYYKLRKEYAGSGKSDISGSNRSLMDALDISRAKLLEDRIFFQATPKIVTPEYAIAGIQFALCARIGNKSAKEDKSAKEEIKGWVNQNFDAVLKEEQDKWWCDFFNKHLSVVQTQIPEIESNFIREVGLYKENPAESIRACAKVKNALLNRTRGADARARIEFPFMDYLFIEQPRMEKVNDDALVQLLDFYVKSQETSSCKLNKPAS